MTKETFLHHFRQADWLEQTLLLAQICATMSNRLETPTIPTEITNGQTKRMIRDFRILQSRRPEDREELEAAITFLRECLAQRRAAR